MQVLLIALTEGERIGLLGLVGVCITAAASISAVVIGQKVRRENSDQHGESQRLLVNPVSYTHLTLPTKRIV